MGLQQISLWVQFIQQSINSISLLQKLPYVCILELLTQSGRNFSTALKHTQLEIVGIGALLGLCRR